MSLRAASSAALFGGIGAFLVFGDASLKWNTFKPLVQNCIDAETSHNLAVWGAGQSPFVRHLLGFAPTSTDFNLSYNDPVLNTTAWQYEFRNPVGLAAGFDKDAQCIQGVLEMGFGAVEIGSVTPLPQDGNPKPRVFRLLQDQALINRYGFNSHGHARVLDRLEDFRKHSNQTKGIVGVNLGKNKTSPDAVGDYCNGIEKFAHVADYLVINISSPNTKGLRDLQGKQHLRNLLQKSKSKRDQIRPSVPLLVKIAPDLTAQDRKDIASVILDVGIDGIIVSNTTIERSEALKSSTKNENGGLSGAPLFEKSTHTLKEMYKLTNGKVVLIGVGGVSNGEQAYEKIKAGASLVQFYSAMAYEGPNLVNKITRELKQLLLRDGYTNVQQAVGVDVSK